MYFWRAERKVVTSVLSLAVTCILSSASTGFAATSTSGLDDIDQNGKVSLGDVIDGLQVLSGVKTETGYSQSDLTGTWYSIGISTPTSGATQEQLLYNFDAEAGQMAILSDGTFRLTTNDDSDIGSISIAASGELTVAGADDVRGMYMNAGKDFLTVVFDNTDDNEQGTLHFVKAADVYWASDLVGNWYVAGTITPTAEATEQERSENYEVESGFVVIQEDGSYQWTTQDGIDTGSLSISAIGWVTEANVTDVLGWYMNAGKDVMTIAFSNPVDHAQGSIVLLKKGDNYSQADLTGTWYATGIITPTSSLYPQNYGAEAGTMTIAADGSYRFVSGGESDNGNLTISATGVISETGAGDVLGWYMNAGKDLMTVVFADATDNEQGQMIFVKKK